MEEKQLYTVTNGTNEVLAVIDVGRFVPGDTEIELTNEQVQLLQNNAILKLSKAQKVAKKAVANEPEENKDK